ncbi:MAG TPA: hypothetical protein VIL11_03865 [Limnochordales bacterium]
MATAGVRAAARARGLAGVGILALGSALAVVVGAVAGPAGAQQGGNPLGMPLNSAVAQVFVMVTGNPPPQDQGLRAQIEQATQMVFGPQGQARIGEGLLNKVVALSQAARPGNPNVSLLSRSMAVEWGLNQSLYEFALVSTGGELKVPSPTVMPLRPLAERVAWVETVLYGRQQAGPLADRLDRLAQDIWGGGQPVQLRTRTVTVQPGAGSIRVRLLGVLSNDRNQLTRPGTLVPVMALEDFRMGDALVIPRGMVGFVRVDEAEPPGPLGRPGRLSASGQMWAVDGTWLGIRLRLPPPGGPGAPGPGASGGAGSGPVPAGLLVEGEARTLRDGDVVLADLGPMPGFTQQPVPEAFLP